MNKPLVSVVMATYNTPTEWLREAIDSILIQTYSNLEFIIIEDCSTNNSHDVLKQYSDPRIKIIRNKSNLGLTKSLNIGLDIAKGKYIARMDADDISFENRLEEQVKFMESNRDIIGCGSYRMSFGLDENIESWKLPSSLDEQKIQLFFYNCGLTHPTAMLNHELLIKHCISYDEKYKKAQDYRLWVECVKYAKLHVIPKVLLKYRKHANQVSVSGKNSQDEYANLIRLEQLKDLKIEPDEQETKIHLGLCKGNYNLSPEAGELWVNKLILSNERYQIFNTKLFNEELNRRWYNICRTKYFDSKNIEFRDTYIRAKNMKLHFGYIKGKVKHKIVQCFGFCRNK